MKQKMTYTNTAGSSVNGLCIDCVFVIDNRGIHMSSGHQSYKKTKQNAQMSVLWKLSSFQRHHHIVEKKCRKLTQT